MDPCGHCHFCTQCAALILAGAVSWVPQCPVCRGNVTGITQVDDRTAAIQAPERSAAALAAQSYQSVMSRIRGQMVATNSAANNSATDRMSGNSSVTEMISTQTRANPADAVSRPPRVMSDLFGPWWPAGEESTVPGETYLNRLQLRDGEVGILPDTGAHASACCLAH